MGQTCRCSRQEYSMFLLCSKKAKGGYKCYHLFNILSHCSWGSVSVAQRIFVLQKRAIRSLFGIIYRDSCKHVFHQKHLLTIRQMETLKCLIYVKEHVTDFTKLKDTHTYNTRFNTDRQTLSHKLVYFEAHTLYNGIML